MGLGYWVRRSKTFTARSIREVYGGFWVALYVSTAKVVKRLMGLGSLNVYLLSDRLLITFNCYILYQNPVIDGNYMQITQRNKL